MSDGGVVPDRADGMGCFDLGDGKIALVRNHELKVGHDAGGALAEGYDRNNAGEVLPGGTTNLVLDAEGGPIDHPTLPQLFGEFKDGRYRMRRSLTH